MTKIAPATNRAKWDRMTEALYVEYPRHLRETKKHSENTVVLSESIVVNGDHFIPANTTLTIDEPAGK